MGGGSDNGLVRYCTGPVKYTAHDVIKRDAARLSESIKGKDVEGQSFVGVAFHGVDDSTYDAVYWRPFNFKTDDPMRHRHAVQYVAQPRYPWSKLRNEHPGEYEQPVNPAPDPNGWFHVRVVIARPTVSAYVGDATEPSLVVTLLNDRRKGRVGLWVGNGSDGDFANLKIVPKE